MIDDMTSVPTVEDPFLKGQPIWQMGRFYSTFRDVFGSLHLALRAYQGEPATTAQAKRQSAPRVSAEIAHRLALHAYAQR